MPRMDTGQGAWRDVVSLVVLSVDVQEEDDYAGSGGGRMEEKEVRTVGVESKGCQCGFR